MELRPYQWEVIMPALEGKNIIIWLPTGAGKTRAAAYVAKRHLETVDKAKVVVLVNRVHLVTQHREEFSRMLDGRWAIATLSGDMGPRAGFGHQARSHDLLICTAELLQMALTSPEEEEHVELSDFSLLVVDECHHTHKDTVYNIILSRYLEHKLRRVWPLPQVLGLTASPGTGGASMLSGAIDHVLQLCANLDTWRIMSPQEHQPQLQEHIRQPCKQYDLCQQRSQDPFGDLLKKLMDQVHDYLEMPELSRDFGTQMYEQQRLRPGSRSGECVQSICGATMTRCSSTTQSAPWTPWTRCRTSTTGSAPLRSRCCLPSAGCWRCSMRDQQEVIRKFRVGILNLLVATSVAEEGLDIPHCNVVVRYGLLTNEISMVQARGRARAGQSVYAFVAAKGSRELRRELTNEALEALMEQAVATVQKMDQAEYQAKIRDLQREALVKRAAQAEQRLSRQQQFLAERVRLFCINCSVAVGHGSDLRKVEGAHHVNVNPNFSIYYTVSQKPVVIDRDFKDWSPGGTISCRNCGEAWGLQIIYKSVKLPVLQVRSMLFETPRGRLQAKKWSRVPFPVPDFNYVQHCAQNLRDLSL
ncbi:ATP-dependent RNA helicase DHX58 isoform X1 [Trichechus manatus latirostris]|uniref:RNA helicase n=1 Tax=Trichechus manatus latirostris TaxID=127582 RepID=A0A2Y9QNX0_TRIMA|nr:ATP-dependent RNA helicase DHX58 isoform X1 [Trichechus manatus latirostris]